MIAIQRLWKRRPLWTSITATCLRSCNIFFAKAWMLQTPGYLPPYIYTYLKDTLCDFLDVDSAPRGRFCLWTVQGPSPGTLAGSSPTTWCVIHDSALWHAIYGLDTSYSGQIRQYWRATSTQRPAAANSAQAIWGAGEMGLLLIHGHRTNIHWNSYS